MRTEFLCISVLGVASGPRVKLASCKSALTPHPPTPVFYSTDRSKAVVPVLVVLFVALWFILRGDLFYVLPCVVLFQCFSVVLALRLPRLGKRELILVLFVRLFSLRLFGFVCFLFLLCVWDGLRLVFVALPGLFSYFVFCTLKKRVREKYMECQNHKPQSFPDTKRKRIQTKPNKHKTNNTRKTRYLGSVELSCS